MKETNKYWLGKDDGEERGIFCEKGKDNIKPYIKDCVEMGGRFDELYRRR